MRATKDYQAQMVTLNQEPRGEAVIRRNGTLPAYVQNALTLLRTERRYRRYHRLSAARRIRRWARHIPGDYNPVLLSMPLWVRRLREWSGT